MYKVQDFLDIFKKKQKLFFYEFFLQNNIALLVPLSKPTLSHPPTIIFRRDLNAKILKKPVYSS